MSGTPTEFKGQVALVTGASRGIGAAIALELAKQGLQVVGTATTDDGAARISAALAAYSGCRGANLNVNDAGAGEALIDDIVKSQGGLHVLVNNAGTTLFVPMSQLDDVQAADFQNIFGTNAIGPFQMCRAVAKHMGPQGAIVNVSSVAAQLGVGSSFPYVLSKAALNSLTVGMARVLAPKIRVNAVLPGMIQGRWMKEGLGDEAYEKAKQQFANSSLLGEVATPEHVASSVCWLLDKDCLMTGQLIVVDGGFTLARPSSAFGKK